MVKAPDDQQRWLTHLALEMVRAGRFNTQRELAEAAGLSRSLLSAITTGSRTATPRARRKLAAALAGGPEAGEELLAELETAPPVTDAVLATGVVSRGFDLPRIRSVLLVERSSKTAIHQQLGRGLSGWDSRHRGQQLVARTEQFLRSFGTVVTGPVHVGAFAFRPDFYMPTLGLVVEVKTNLNRQDRLEAVIGAAVVARSALGVKVVVVTDERPDELAEQSLGEAGILVAWFEDDELVGDGVERVLKPSRSKR